MSKIKINVDKLLVGMHVIELDKPWSETSFLFQGFRITNNQEIEQLQESCSYVYIDEEKSTVDISSNLITNKSSPREKKDHKCEQLSNIQVKHKPYEEKFESEFPVAKEIYLDSTEKMHVFFNDV
ncbi:MAG: DUF3391 domain-containing protein, partial [Gammaproteobacteria bacterium]|nr:DUF3391 domain-containing protein [Gammaproteobacteria bacterium]